LKAFINWPIFTQTSIDSGSLTMLGSVLHNFSEPGIYMGTILQNNEAVSTFQLIVDKDSPATQVDIDLASLHQGKIKHSCSDDSKRFEVNPKGYAVFYVSRGSGGYSVVVGRLDENEKARLFFDSRELKEGDIFTATIIRPGLYTVTNIKTKSSGKIVVTYPKRGKVPFRPPRPKSIECNKDSLDPNKIEIHATQGQIYKIKTPSRIKIELIEPDDGSKVEKERIKKKERQTRKQKNKTSK